MKRRLAAILATDVVGYSRLVREDESGTLAVLKAHRNELIGPKIVQHGGRIVKLTGDGLLAEFPSAVEAVHCAVEIQHWLKAHNSIETRTTVQKDERITYRAGINIGDIVAEDDDIYGDGVNVAARLEALAEPGGICIARNVYNQVKDKLDLTFEHCGDHKVKNIAEPLTVYSVAMDEKAAALATPFGQVKIKAWGLQRPLAITAAALVIVLSGLVFWQSWRPDSWLAFGPAERTILSDKPSLAVLSFDTFSNGRRVMSRYVV